MKVHNLERGLILPDAHTPFHNKRAVEKLIIGQVLPAFKWDFLVILGDWFDNYICSRFSKAPERLRGLLNELKQGFELLNIFESYPFKRRIFIEGNHERRLPKMVQDKAPEVYEIVMEWWATKFTKWEYIPYMEDIQIGEVFFTHDVGRSGIHSTRQTLGDYQHNAIIGHNHRMDYHIQANAKGVAHVGASFGWLGDIEGIDYMHRMKCRRDWPLGFGEAYLRPNGIMHLIPVPIINYSAVVGGKLFVA